MAQIINPAGRIAITGVWPTSDPRAADPALARGKLTIPWSQLFNKGVRIVMGRDDDTRWNRKLRDMIITGAARPSQVVSHRLTFDDAPEAFAKFDAREDGFIKVVLEPS
jgi:glutathione-independent formaldehyde dehydrogenase